MEEEFSVPEWFVSFADMVSLLMTFFIMLFSLAGEGQEENYQAMVEALHETFGYDSSMSPGEGGSLDNIDIEAIASVGRAERKKAMLTGLPTKAPPGEQNKVTALRPDGDPAIGGVVYFNELDTTLTKSDKQTLQIVVERVTGMPQRIEIRGHTSKRPLGNQSPYKDHWDLAYARCRVVEKYLEELGINRERMRLGVAAANEPKYEETDKILQQENSRVEVLILNEIVRKKQIRKDVKDVKDVINNEKRNNSHTEQSGSSGS